MKTKYENLFSKAVNDAETITPINDIEEIGHPNLLGVMIKRELSRMGFSAKNIGGVNSLFILTD